MFRQPIDDKLISVLVLVVIIIIIIFIIIIIITIINIINVINIKFKKNNTNVLCTIFLLSVFQVKNLFLPPNNDLKHKFWHGYVAHHEQMALYKLDLEAMKYVKMIDLKAYKCVPGAVAFIPVGMYKMDFMKISR